jgi:hypothetical protein
MAAAVVAGGGEKWTCVRVVLRRKHGRQVTVAGRKRKSCAVGGPLIPEK